MFKVCFYGNKVFFSVWPTRNKVDVTALNAGTGNIRQNRSMSNQTWHNHFCNSHSCENNLKCRKWKRLDGVLGKREPSDRFKNPVLPVRGKTGQVVRQGRLPSALRCCSASRERCQGKRLTFHMTLAVLGDDASAIHLISRPLVDKHGAVGGACIQDHSILGEIFQINTWERNSPG